MLVRKVDGEWKRWTEPALFDETVSVCDRIYHDGRVDHDVPCDPYVRQVQLAPDAVSKALSAGAWNATDLERFGLAEAAPFVPPSGKRRVGEPRYEERDGGVYEVYDVDDIVVPPSPAVDGLTRDQKIERFLSSYGLTKEDITEAFSIDGTGTGS